MEAVLPENQRFYDGLGMAGVALYLGSYAALQTGLLKGQTYAYAVLNILAASLVLVSLSRDFNLASAAIQVSWIVISAVGIARLLIIHCQTAFTPDEKVLVRALAPDLPRNRARKLLSLGAWRRAARCDVLVRQGQEIAWLGYLFEGSCEVEQDGLVVARIGPDSLVGEMGYLSGEPASATVRGIEDVRLFVFDAQKLRLTLARHPDLASALEHSVARVLRRRLATATLELCSLRRAMAAGGAQAEGPLFCPTPRPRLGKDPSAEQCGKAS